MTTFIKNEMIKVKSEKFMVIVFLLSLLPFIMNLVNFFINNKDLSLIGGFYFRFYNQYFMLAPIMIGIIGSSIFYIEFKENTLLNWLTYSNSKFKLFFSKVIVSLLYCAFLYATNLILVCGFYLVMGRSIEDLMEIFISFSVLNIILIMFIVPLSITSIIMFQNYVVSVVIILGIAMFSMMVILAPFAHLIPTTLGYWLGLVSIDSSLVEITSLNLIIGGLVLVIVSVIITYIGIRNLKIK
ncbi:ABC transporter permease [Staphylococcus auricularis]|uniref:ABC transporter permease n=1 Tax=Staphylococcus auricularis TaxID=29379 RepID=UPI0024307BE1|nr:ABC transporter permease [Staphylococcus auricularis]